MERTSMAALITGIICATALLGGIIVGTSFAQVEGTKQLTACAEAGGSYLPLDGNPVCVMPGQDIPEQ
ncbi:membrane protein [Microbacterium phage Huwbert]|nr:membrane protein [Microbacterium phage Huwbert]